MTSERDGSPRLLVRVWLALGLAVVAVLVVVFGPWHTSRQAATTIAISRQISGEDAGNGRPDVGRYTGLMVRRCEAVALYATPNARVATLRRALHDAAAAAGTTVRDVSTEVLSPATLDQQVPDVVGCLPDGSTRADALPLLRRRLPGEDHHRVEAVLVHELRFLTPPGRRHTDAALAAAVLREGILSDTLGVYTARSAPHGALSISYTGALLGAGEVEGVRDAIARQSGLPARSVRVMPLSNVGVGVDVASEPPPAGATETDAPAVHDHHHSGH